MNTDLLLVSFMTGYTSDKRIVSVKQSGAETIIVLQDAPPDFRHISAEFLDGWTWKLAGNRSDETTTFRLNREHRHVDVSGNICGIKNLALTVKEVRTVGLPCSDARPMMMTEAGVFMLHPQLRVKANQRVVCYTGGGVVHLGNEGVEAAQINFGQHWPASQAGLITTLWNADY